MLGYIYWDPSRYMFDFSLPLLNRPILWYGFLFAAGFFIGYFLLRYLLATYLLTRPYFAKEDILLPSIIPQLIKQNKDAAFIKEKSKGYEGIKEGKKSSLQVYWSECLNKLLESSKIPQDDLLKVACIKNYTQSLSSHARELLARRLYLQKLLSPALCTIGQKAKIIAEKISFACILGAVIGARLGDVLFYQSFDHLIHDPLLVFKVWEGGLASHGGAVGVLVALYILSRKKEYKAVKISFLKMLDLIVIPTALVGAMIRLGNFINQEILGRQADVPWAVVFGHPADGSMPVPRHPVQLYEAACYFLLFVVLSLSWKKWFELKKSGRLFGLFLMLLFSLRFILEFWKTEQSEYLRDHSFLTMGQYLSLPFILLGVFFFFRRRK